MCFGNIVYNVVNGSESVLLEQIEETPGVMGLVREPFFDSATLKKSDRIQIIKLTEDLKQVSVEIEIENSEKTREQLEKISGVRQVVILESIHRKASDLKRVELAKIGIYA
jgi:hypothetical protein